MSQLNDLIEQLYAQGLPDALTDGISAADAVSLPTSNGERDTHRLMRILNEMGSYLHQEDQPDLDIPLPTDEACLHIMNHWEAMQRQLDGTHQHMKSLEQDIVKMQPWGNFDVMKVEKLAERGCNIRFWQLSSFVWAEQLGQPWHSESNVLLVAQDTEIAYFVTVTPQEVEPQVPRQALEIEICPCPVSTLIMLQTRDKDSLTRLETLMGDYALCHYGEIYVTLAHLLPPDISLPQLTSQHHSWHQKLRTIFKL